VLGLKDLSFSKFQFQAPKGENGSGRGCHGKNGRDIVVTVPVGTVVKVVPPHRDANVSANFNVNVNVNVNVKRLIGAGYKPLVQTPGGHGGRAEAAPPRRRRPRRPRHPLAARLRRRGGGGGTWQHGARVEDSEVREGGVLPTFF
jgi:GTPase involved in cell partitioning and DNA repair